MRFLLGLVIGALVGGGGVYLALEKPWDSGETASAAEPDAGMVASSRPGKKKRRKGKRRKGKRNVEIDVTGDIPELTAADRKMMWKGQSVKLPERQIDFEGGGEARPLSGSEINQVIQNESGAILDCITKARGNAPLKAKITVKMLVGPDGKVTRSRFRAPAYLFEHGFYACARKAAGRMRFPATGGHTVVDAPFDLY